MHVVFFTELWPSQFAISSFLHFSVYEGRVNFLKKNPPDFLVWFGFFSPQNSGEGLSRVPVDTEVQGPVGTRCSMWH